MVPRYTLYIIILKNVLDVEYLYFYDWGTGKGANWIIGTKST